MNVQNPQLYSLLQRNFAHVKVSGGGSALVRHLPNWHHGGRPSTHVTGGEFYQVCCPFCRDTRYRLWLNALWGTRDEVTGRELWHLAICYNEDCLSSPGHRMRLREMVYALPAQSRRRAQAPPVVPPSAPRAPIQLPVDCVPVSSSPRHVREYLVQRGFDPHELSERWDVSYAEHATDVRPQLTDRIVIPIWLPARRAGAEKGYLGGWQARAVGNGTEVCKYLNCTGMKKSELLYGLTTVTNGSGPVVVVEGVTDVWRLGSDAVALLGKTISTTQVAMLIGRCAGRPILIMLDDDAQQEAQQTRDRIRAALPNHGSRSTVQLLAVPGRHHDVAECSRDELWEAVHARIGKR